MLKKTLDDVYKSNKGEAKANATAAETKEAVKANTQKLKEEAVKAVGLTLTGAINKETITAAIVAATGKLTVPSAKPAPKTPPTPTPQATAAKK